MGEVESLLRARLAREPASDDARIALGAWLLKHGDFQAGWHYLYPVDAPTKYMPAPDHRAPWPWRGERLDGKTILVYPDEGLGDMIQWFPLLAALRVRGAASVVAQVPRTLQRLFALNAPPGVRLLAWEDEPEDKARYGADFYCAFSRLPGLLGVGVATLPLAGGDLRADPADVQRWQSALAAERGKLKVGVAWQGNPKHARDSLRSMPVEAMKAVVLPGVAYYSLQFGAPAADPFVDCTPQLRDFADTAALVANLDAVVTVDTSTAHLACAMGRTTFVLIDAEGDWRWGTGERSLWYPAAAHLVRQPAPGDWQTVVARVAAALADLAASRRRA